MLVAVDDVTRRFDGVLGGWVSAGGGGGGGDGAHAVVETETHAMRERLPAESYAATPTR
jgi:hypothetical protein